MLLFAQSMQGPPAKLSNPLLPIYPNRYEEQTVPRCVTPYGSESISHHSTSSAHPPRKCTVSESSICRYRLTTIEYIPSDNAGSINFSPYSNNSWPIVSHSPSRFLGMKTSSSKMESVVNRCICSDLDDNEVFSFRWHSSYNGIIPSPTL